MRKYYLISAIKFYYDLIKINKHRYFSLLVVDFSTMLSSLIIDAALDSSLSVADVELPHRGLVSAVVLKLGSTEPQGFGEAVAGVRLRSE